LPRQCLHALIDDFPAVQDLFPVFFHCLSLSRGHTTQQANNCQLKSMLSGVGTDEFPEVLVDDFFGRSERFLILENGGQAHENTVKS